MAFCTKCGFKLGDNSKFCPNCGTEARVADTNQNTINQGIDPAEESGGPYARDDNFGTTEHNPSIGNYNYQQTGMNWKPKMASVLAEGERVIRSYECCRQRTGLFDGTTGFLHVTNKRIIYSCECQGSKAASEVKFDTVSGIDSSYGTNYRFSRIIIGAFLILEGFITAMTSTNEIVEYAEIGAVFWLVGAIVIAIGIAIILSGIQKNFMLNIFSSEATGAPISLGAGPVSIKGNAAAVSFRGAPARDTNRMLDELGALVIDLQKRDELAIEKWEE